MRCDFAQGMMGEDKGQVSKYIQPFASQTA